MNLSGIISISGRPGLFKIITQAKNSIIVESIVDKKRFPAYSKDRVSALEDISIYTYEDDQSLKEIFIKIYTKTEGKEAPSHKESINILVDFLSDIIPNYDKDRVYPSDIKKLFQWFNLLMKNGYLKLETKKENSNEKKDVKKQSNPKPSSASKKKKQSLKK